MAIFVPDQAINNELQETVTRQSIRRMIQAGTNILTANSETQQNQVLAAAQAAGVQASVSNPIFLWRTDAKSVHAFTGTQWEVTVPPPGTVVVSGNFTVDSSTTTLATTSSIRLPIPATAGTDILVSSDISSTGIITVGVAVDYGAGLDTFAIRHKTVSGTSTGRSLRWIATIPPA